MPTWWARASDCRAPRGPSIGSWEPPGRICGRRPHHQEPCERPAPMRQWQVDFKDASTVPREAEGKQQHVVEVLNTIDMGTSILVAAQVGADFTAQTTLHCLRWSTPIAGWTAAMAGQRVALHLSANARAWIVIQGTQVLKTLPLKGLYGAALPFERFVEFMMGQALAEQRLRTAQQRRARHGPFSSP